MKQFHNLCVEGRRGRDGFDIVPPIHLGELTLGILNRMKDAFMVHRPGKDQGQHAPISGIEIADDHARLQPLSFQL